MFGFTKLTPEEKAERDVKFRILEIQELIKDETRLRQESLDRCVVLRDELESLLGA